MQNRFYCSTNFENCQLFFIGIFRRKLWSVKKLQSFFSLFFQLIPEKNNWKKLKNGWSAFEWFFGEQFRAGKTSKDILNYPKSVVLPV